MLANQSNMNVNLVIITVTFNVTDAVVEEIHKGLPNEPIMNPFNAAPALYPVYVVIMFCMLLAKFFS